MPKRDVSAAAGESGSDNPATNAYERQRAKRIAENRARMAALRLPRMANSMKRTMREKRKKDEDDDGDDGEYVPIVEESDDEEDEEWSESRTAKGKKKVSIPKKRAQVQKLRSNSDFVDEDEAFMQALALSIESKRFNVNESCSGLSVSPDKRPTNGKSSEKRGNARIQESSGARKQKKQVSSRVQMTEDELVVHFFQFDEAGKGSISVNDLEFMAATHDFTWTDKELADMIYCFDTDGDGKLSLDDFRKIVGRCNMVQS